MAQQINEHVREGNTLYKQKKFDKALPEYQKSVEEGMKDPITSFNLGDAFYRNSRYEEAAKTFDKPANESKEPGLKQWAFYNKGVSLSKQNKLEESIDAYKTAVMMNPRDNDARVNLQKALLELKKKQPPEQQKKENDNKKKQQDKKDQQKEPPKSNLTKKQVEQLLKALQQREQMVQQKMQNNRNRTAGQQEKDW
jgi:tetratricopeptide (TPR) repeat protein